MSMGSTTRQAAGGEPVFRPDDSIATRQSLLRRLQNQADEATWQEFFETYWSLIYQVARRAGLSDADAQDVVQETVISVARNVEGFVYDPTVCSFRKWMLKVTRWRILDRLAQRQREAARQSPPGPVQEGTRTSTVDRIPDPATPDFESVWDREWVENLLQIARERTKRRVPPDYYQIYDCCVHHDLPAGKVARLLDTNIAKVYLAKHRVSRVFQQEVERLHREIARQEQA